MSIGKRIRKRRRELGLSADAVAEMLGRNRATVYRYESDDIEDMPINVIKDLAEILKVDPGYLMGWKDNPENLINEYDYPIFPSISAGLPLEVNGVYESNIERISIPDYLMGKWAKDKTIYFTRINGNSMNNVLPHNSLIAVKPVEEPQLKNGDIVVYRKNGEYAVKRFYKDISNNRIIFRPDSKDEAFIDDVVPLDSVDDLLIKGKVILFIVEMD